MCVADRPPRHAPFPDHFMGIGVGEYLKMFLLYCSSNIDLHESDLNCYKDGVFIFQCNELLQILK